MAVWWEVLGVQANATVDEILDAWRVSVQIIHPDRHHGAGDTVLAEAERRVRELNDARDEGIRTATATRQSEVATVDGVPLATIRRASAARATWIRSRSMRLAAVGAVLLLPILAVLAARETTTVRPPISSRSEPGLSIVDMSIAPTTTLSAPADGPTSTVGPMAIRRDHSVIGARFSGAYRSISAGGRAFYDTLEGTQFTAGSQLANGGMTQIGHVYNDGSHQLWLSERTCSECEWVVLDAVILEGFDPSSERVWRGCGDSEAYLMGTVAVGSNLDPEGVDLVREVWSASLEGRLVKEDPAGVACAEPNYDGA